MESTADPRRNRQLRATGTMITILAICLGVSSCSSWHDILLINFSSDSIEIDIPGRCQTTLPAHSSKAYDASGCSYISGDITLEITNVSTGQETTKHYSKEAVKTLMVRNDVVVLELH